MNGGNGGTRESGHQMHQLLWAKTASRALCSCSGRNADRRRISARTKRWPWAHSLSRKRANATSPGPAKNVKPACLQSSRYDWLRASLDGFTVACDAVVEIKCGESVYRRVSQSRSVPDYYYGQLQHILAVTGLESLDFWCFWPGYPELLVSVGRNNAYIERLLNRELEFWNQIQQNT